MQNCALRCTKYIQKYRTEVHQKKTYRITEKMRAEQMQICALRKAKLRIARSEKCRIRHCVAQSTSENTVQKYRKKGAEQNTEFGTGLAALNTSEQ